MADIGKMLIAAAKRTPGITVIEVDTKPGNKANKKFKAALKTAGYTYEKYDLDNTHNYWFHGKNGVYQVEIFHDGYLVAWNLQADYFSKERRAIETNDPALMVAELKKLL